MRRMLAGVTAAVLLAGCGSSGSPVVTEGAAPGSPYSGSMELPVSSDDEANPVERSGTAGNALECETEPYEGGGGDYDSGLASVQDSPGEAVTDLIEEQWIGDVPAEGYRIERSEDGRVLLSFDVGRLTKVAFVAADDVRDHAGDVGWGIEGWATCDPAELPAAVTADYQLTIWTDAAGNRVPVRRVHSFAGAEHCDWEDVTFLQVGPEGRRTEYLRDPEDVLAGVGVPAFDGSATLPPDAVDQNARSDGRALWTTPDAAYLVDVDDPTDVERWPAPAEPVGCM